MLLFFAARNCISRRLDHDSTFIPVSLRQVTTCIKTQFYSLYQQLFFRVYQSAAQKAQDNGLDWWIPLWSLLHHTMNQYLDSTMNNLQIYTTQFTHYVPDQQGSANLQHYTMTDRWWPCDGLMLGQRLRRCPNIKPSHGRSSTCILVGCALYYDAAISRIINSSQSRSCHDLNVIHHALLPGLCSAMQRQTAITVHFNITAVSLCTIIS